MIRVGLKSMNGLHARASNTNIMRAGVRAVCPSQNYCILLSNKRLLKEIKLHAPISMAMVYVDERFHTAFLSRPRSGLTSPCHPGYFTLHFSRVIGCQKIISPVPDNFQAHSLSRPRTRDTKVFAEKFNKAFYRFSHSEKNSKLQEDQGERQQFHSDAWFASLLSISTFFVIYCLWKKVYNEDIQLYRAALCLSQDSDSKIYNDKSMEDNLTKASDVSSNFLSPTACQTQNGIHSRSSGKIQGNIEETDTLSFRQAVEKVDDLLEKRKTEVGSPGIVVCVSVDGKYVYAKGFGHADVENQVPIHPHSVIRIASISKAITAAIVAKLVDEGKIKLDESVYHYVPTFPAKDFHGEKVDITVRQLLNHTSGIRSYWLENDPVLAFQPKFDEMMSAFDTGIQHLFYSNLKGKGPPKKQTDKETKKNIQNEEQTSLSVLPPEYYKAELFTSTTKALEMFSKDRLVAKPDTRYLYSTLAYTLLAAVVESVTKKSFTSVAKETFHLWGMKETYLDQNDPLIYNRARHYQKKKGTLVNTPYIDVSYKWAGGGFLSTVMDVVKFGNILLYSSQHSDHDSGLPGYLKQSTVQEFWTSIENKRTSRKYGLGFELSPCKMAFGMCPVHSSGAGHSGGAVGASSNVFILPRTNIQTKVYNDKKIKTSIKTSPNTSHGSAQISDKDALSLSQTQLALPQGVVVAVMVNLIGVSLGNITEEIAYIFERVVLD